MDRRDFVKTLAGTAVALLAGDAVLTAQPPTSAFPVPDELLELLKLKGRLYTQWDAVWNLPLGKPAASKVEGHVSAPHLDRPETWLPAFDTATLFENQRLFNEIASGGSDSAPFKRMSLPLVYRTFNHHYVGHHLVNFTAMVGPRQKTWWHDDCRGFVSNSESIMAHSALQGLVTSTGHLLEVHNSPRWHLEARTQKYKAIWVPETQRDLRSNYNLAEEGKLCAVLAENMAFDLNHGIVEQIENAVLGGKNYFHARHIGTALGKVVHAVGASCGHEANWAVMGEDAIKHFHSGSLGQWSMRKVAEFQGVHLYFDSRLSPSRIVAGYKPRSGRVEDAFGGGMVHGMYVPCAITPTVFDPTTLALQQALLVRHDYKFREDGGVGYYAVADVK